MKLQNHLKKKDDLRIHILSNHIPSNHETEHFFKKLGGYKIEISQTLPPPYAWDIAVLPVSGLLHWSSLISAFPVILTGPPEYILEASSAGCVDYMRDNWTPEELFFRIHKYLEYNPTNEHSIPDQLNTMLNFQEKRIMQLLLSKSGQPVHRTTIQFHLWGEERPASRGIDMHIANIRKKISQNYPQDEMLIIKTVHGCGYLVNKQK